MRSEICYAAFITDTEILNQTPDTLDLTSDILCLKFAKKCTLNSKTSHMFPKKRNQMIMTQEDKISLWFTMQIQNE